MLCDDMGETLGCTPYRTHAKSAQVVPRVYANIEGCRTPVVQRSKEQCAKEQCAKEQCADISISLRQYT